MNIKPIASPADIKGPGPSDAKARAVAAFNNAGKVPHQQPAEQQAGTPPVDQNAISSEELGAIIPQTPEPTPDKPTEVVEAKEDTPAAEPTKEEIKQDPAVQRQFSQLARQERAFRAKQQQQNEAFKAREAALAAREAELTAKNTQFNPSDYISKAQIKQDALTALTEAGVSYDDVTQQLINQQPTDPRITNTIARLESKIKLLEEQAETGKKTYVEQQQAQYQAAVKQITADAKALVKSDPVTYEAISKTGTVREVVKLIEDTFNKDGVVLSVEEAAQEVENYLVDENYKMATNIDKIKKRMAQSNASTAKPDVKTQATPKQTQMKTLTNAVSSTRKLTARERAVLAFKGELKS